MIPICNILLFTDHFEDDQISETTSGESCSVGGLYRFNDVVGLSDVQNMARMQEESKKRYYYHFTLAVINYAKVSYVKYIFILYL